MAGLVRDYCVVLVEILCCKIFFDTFCETEETDRKKTWMLPVVLSVLVFGTVCIFEHHTFVKEVFIIGITTVLMLWNNGKSIKRNLTLAVIFQSVLLIVDYIMLVFKDKSIAIIKCSNVKDTFHARYSAHKKIYVYKIKNDDKKDVFLSRYYS